MKHKHKWILQYVDGGTIGRGLLYSCDCGTCLEFKKRKPKIEELIHVINELSKFIYK